MRETLGSSHGLQILSGDGYTLGPRRTERGHGFAVYCTGAAQVALQLFPDADDSPPVRFDLDPVRHRSGDIRHIEVVGLQEPFEYRWEVQRGDVTHDVADPYARMLSGAPQWAEPGSALRNQPPGIRPRRCWVGQETFESYEGPPVAGRKIQSLTEHKIYELHVRGFTRHPSSGVARPGTYAGLQEKIGYLRELGVTAVEWMPCHEFDEGENPSVNPVDGSRLLNFWGYDAIQFFAPKAGYAHTAKPGGVLREIRETIAAFHEAGIEVWLDVVFNHTVEGGRGGPTVCFKALAPEAYYLTGDDGEFLDHTGCGHTVQANHPSMRQMILDALTWWHKGIGFDGFRFDLAAALTRDERGRLMEDPPLMIEIAKEEALSEARLFAEVWDAAGAYRLGEFPRWGRWAEWNGRFRDNVRRFWRGDHDASPQLATSLVGSPDLYQRLGVGPGHGVNYIASHDGAPLRDLVSYGEKRNIANGEEERDGDTHEIRCLRDDGESPAGLSLPAPTPGRLRMIKALWGSLLVSQGAALWFMGDERGQTHFGNNNVWCQDNELGWLDWSFPEGDEGKFRHAILRFVQRMTTLRERCGAFHLDRWLETEDDPELAVHWHSVDGGPPDWHGDRQLVLEWVPKDMPPVTVIFDAEDGSIKTVWNEKED